MSRPAMARSPKPPRPRDITLCPILEVEDDFVDEPPAEWASPHWSSDEETPGLHVADWDALD